MDLKYSFIANKPREKAGATSSSRFGFQKDVSLSMLLEHEEGTGNDYVFIFDYHEDLVIMDAERNPLNASFYQIKGKKTGTWSLKALSKTELDATNKPLLSTLGKLYDCRRKFINQTDSLNFLSNARYKMGLADKSQSESKDDLKAIDLCEKDLKSLTDSLKNQLLLTDDLELSDLNFKVLNISLTDSERHLKGILADFFKRRFDLVPDVDTIYKNFLNEINKRSNFQYDIGSFDELLKHKAISKSAFSSWVAHIVHSERSLKDKWQELFALLNRENIHHQKIKELKEGWTTYILLAKDPNNQYIKTALNLVNKAAKGINTQLSLYEQVEIIYLSVKEKLPSGLGEENITKAIILDQLY